MSIVKMIFSIVVRQMIKQDLQVCGVKMDIYNTYFYPTQEVSG